MSALNCKRASEIEAKLLDSFKEKAPEAKGHSIALQGYGFGIIGNEMVSCASMPYKATATFPLKKGGEKPKTINGNMIFSYCPFCGVKGGAA